MIKVLFLCHGNICRSPMAQFVFKKYVDEAGLSDKFEIESKALSREEIGEGIHHGTIGIFKKYDIPYEKHYASEFKKSDYQYYDYILLMDQSNQFRMSAYIKDDYLNKIELLLENRSIADPWYTGNFEKTYQDVVLGCKELLKRIRKDYNI